jgi:phosphate butyryltransferase
LISNVFAFEKPSGGLCLLTDPSILISPSLEQKAQMIANAVELARALGISRPKVAVIAAVETVTSSMSETIEAAALAKMAQRGQIKDCLVDGPLALDNAVSALAARIKGIDSEVAGDADILLCQHIVVANVLSKALAFYAGKELAANVVGTSHPVVLVSRADSPKTRLLSIALGKARLSGQTG